MKRVIKAVIEPSRIGPDGRDRMRKNPGYEAKIEMIQDMIADTDFRIAGQSPLVVILKNSDNSQSHKVSLEQPKSKIRREVDFIVDKEGIYSNNRIVIKSVRSALNR